MATFTPFMQSKTYQDVIQNRINTPTTYNTNSAGNFRNPLFDLRTQQELAGELDPTAIYPNPLLNTAVTQETTPDDPYACPIGQTYDPVLGQCVPITEQIKSDNEETTDPVYRDVGSVYSPEQNAFMNLGLGSEYYGSGKLDFYGDGLMGLFKRFSPLAQLGIYLDAKKLLDAGVIDKRDDGYYFAKGGNLNLVQNNQAWENQLAQNNMLDFAQNVLGKSAEEAQVMANNTKRGDKADYIGSQVYQDNNANVTVNPFESKYGASQIVSYNTKNNNNNNNNQRTGFDNTRAGKSVGNGIIRGGI